MYDEDLKEILKDVYEITEKKIAIFNKKGCLITCNNREYFNSIKKKNEEIVNEIIKKIEKKEKIENYLYEILEFDDDIKYYILIKGTKEENLNYLKLIKIFIIKTIKKKDIHFEQENFIKKILLNDIYEKNIETIAENLNISFKQTRIVAIVKTYEKITLDIKKNIEKYSDLVLKTDTNEMVIIKEIKNEKEYEKFIQNLKETSDKFNNIVAGVGGFLKDLSYINESFKKAKTALKIKEIFELKENIINYNSLGILRLIYKLPASVCEIFLNEIFKKKNIKNLDDEILHTMDIFFKNNLNISETSRKLFIHRNTLIYRLEKIKNLTGLDLKIFDDAIIFKIALMVQKYLDYIIEKEVKT